jgi:hypothetical protein
MATLAEKSAGNSESRDVSALSPPAEAATSTASLTAW